MKNPLKRISRKDRKELDAALTDTINGLMKQCKEAEKKRSALDIRCQSLELTIIEQQKKIKELEELARSRGEQNVKLRQELHEARFTAAAYERIADRAIHEQVQLKRKYCTPCTEGAGKQADKEVSSNARM